ncbi:hypothetical protein ACXJJ3_18465 [Kribbella sp. WER1]
MAADNSGGDVVHVQDVDALDTSASELGTVAGTFHDGLASAGAKAGAAGAAGGTAESQVFMQQQQQAHDLLAQFMTKTAGGLEGYHGAAQQLSNEHHGLVHLTRSRLQTLLRPHDGAVPNDRAFTVHPAGGN